jgi:hypothetical protein
MAQFHNLKVKIDSTTIADGESVLSPNNISIDFEQVDSNQSVGNINSSFLNASWKGPESNKWKHLPHAVLSMADQYFPIMENLGFKRKKKASLLIKQAIELKIAFSEPDKWLKIILPQLKQLDTLGIDLNWNPVDTLFSLNIFSPKINYADMGWNHLTLESKGKYSGFNLLVQIDSIFVKDKLDIPLLELSANVQNDSLFSALNIWRDSLTNLLSINNLIVKGDEHYKLSFRTPFVLNEKKWNVESGNFIYLGANDLDFEPLIIQKDNQLFSISKKEKNKDGLNVQLKNFDITELQKSFP